MRFEFCNIADSKETGEAIVNEVKQCSRCGEIKPHSEFYKNAASSDKLRSWCKDCDRQSMGYKRKLGPRKKIDQIERCLRSRWKKMMGRCYDCNHPSYKNYGGRGIIVCQQWHIFQAYMDWALSNGFAENLEIDRIDTNGNYEPSNCRFVTHSQNNLTRRKRGKFVGVKKNKYRFTATITINYKNIHIGVFDSKEEAARARDDYVMSHGIIATMNFT